MQSLQAYKKLEKRGDPQIAPQPQMVGDPSNRQALGSVLGLGLASAGLGAGGRALLGLKELWEKSLRGKRKPAHPAVVEVGVPELAPNYKVAGFPDVQVPDGIKPNIGRSQSERPGVLDWFAGRTHTDIPSKPWVIPAGVGAAVGGTLGGYHLVDSLLGRLNKRDKDREVEDAKEEYRKALIEQYTPDSPALKTAETNALAKDLEELTQLVKKAGINDTAGQAAGGYLALAGLLAGGTGIATYNWAKSHSPEERLAKAIKQRERLRWATRPPEIYAVAKPVPVGLNHNMENTFSPATPEDEAEVRKVATASANKLASLYKP
jgi:hypothetical protein